MTNAVPMLKEVAPLVTVATAIVALVMYLRRLAIGVRRESQLERLSTRLRANLDTDRRGMEVTPTLRPVVEIGVRRGLLATFSSGGTFRVGLKHD